MPRTAIMQPYFFPYTGYFQLILAADTFVFYDDVNFIQQGWINRNRILIHDKPAWLTIPCRAISSNRLICETEHLLDEKRRTKIIKKVEAAYGRAPYFNDVIPVFHDVLHIQSSSVSDLAVSGIDKTLKYLGIERTFRKSSQHYSDTRTLGRTERLLAICRQENTTVYINSPGGKELYRWQDFSRAGIALNFFEPEPVVYPQFNDPFVPGLSILDVLMFNSPDQVVEMLGRGKIA